MNYEQKYKSALEWMRSIYPTMRGADKEDAKHYFHELCESEDEMIRKDIVEYLKSRGASKRWDFNIWIAWLEKQGEQPLAWSDEDEKMKSLIISTLTSMGTLNLERYHHMNLDEVKNWLKSLKPNHWKPSEEQMEALKYFISFHEDHARSLTTKWEEFKNIESLYNDLKNL